MSVYIQHTSCEDEQQSSKINVNPNLYVNVNLQFQPHHLIQKKKIKKEKSLIFNQRTHKKGTDKSHIQYCTFIHLQFLSLLPPTVFGCHWMWRKLPLLCNQHLKFQNYILSAVVRATKRNRALL